MLFEHVVKHALFILGVVFRLLSLTQFTEQARHIPLLMIDIEFTVPAKLDIFGELAGFLGLVHGLLILLEMITEGTFFMFQLVSWLHNRYCRYSPLPSVSTA